MSVGLKPLEQQELLPVSGIRLASIDAGIYTHKRDDLLLIELVEETKTAALFTRNRFCAAPVEIARKHLEEGNPHYLLINAGNANAGTGNVGVENASLCCQRLAELSGVSKEQVLPFSTGVIGQQLPVENIQKQFSSLISDLTENHWFSAAHCILTTDTQAKGITKQVEIDGETVTITGIAKGAGMIKPDMATMLCFIATDAKIEQDLLNQLLKRSTERSFHRITVDGDTSTNDACVLMATGKSKVALFSEQQHHIDKFQSALNELFCFLAQAIIRDAEGVTKFITLDIQQGRDVNECLDLAYTIAHSPLVKTAFFASDPNWGRLLAAIGRSDLEDLNVGLINLYLEDVLVIERGGVAASYTEEAGQSVMNQDEICVRIELGRGEHQVTVWTSDLSHDYITINAEYRT